MRSVIVENEYSDWNPVDELSKYLGDRKYAVKVWSNMKKIDVVKQLVEAIIVRLDKEEEDHSELKKALEVCMSQETLAEDDVSRKYRLCANVLFPFFEFTMESFLTFFIPHCFFLCSYILTQPVEQLTRQVTKLDVKPSASGGPKEPVFGDHDRDDQKSGDRQHDRHPVDDVDRIHLFAHSENWRSTITALESRVKSKMSFVITRRDEIAKQLESISLESSPSKRDHQAFANFGCTGSGKTVACIQLASHFLHKVREKDVSPNERHCVAAIYITFNSTTSVNLQERVSTGHGSRLVGSILASVFPFVRISTQGFCDDEAVDSVSKMFDGVNTRLCIIVDELKLLTQFDDRAPAKFYLSFIQTLSKQQDISFHLIVSAYDSGIINSIETGSREYCFETMSLPYFEIEDFDQMTIEVTDCFFKPSPTSTETVKIMNVADYINNNNELKSRFLMCHGRPRAVGLLIQFVEQSAKKDCKPTLNHFDNYVANLCQEAIICLEKDKEKEPKLLDLLIGYLCGEKIPNTSDLSAFCDSKGRERLTSAVVELIFQKWMMGEPQITSEWDYKKSVQYHAFHLVRSVTNVTASDTHGPKVFERHMMHFMMMIFGYTCKSSPSVNLSHAFPDLPDLAVKPNFMLKEHGVIEVRGFKNDNIRALDSAGWFLCEHVSNKAIEGGFVMEKPDGKLMLLTVQMKFCTENREYKAHGEKLAQVFADEDAGKELFPAGVYHLYLSLRKAGDQGKKFVKEGYSTYMSKNKHDSEQKSNKKYDDMLLYLDTDSLREKYFSLLNFVYCAHKLRKKVGDSGAVKKPTSKKKKKKKKRSKRK